MTSTPAESASGTGRLFRSCSADPDVAPDAIVALPSARRDRDPLDTDPEGVPGVHTDTRSDAYDAVAAYAFGTTGTRPDPGRSDVEEAEPLDSPADASAPPARARAAAGSGALTLFGIWVVIVGATVIMGLADALVREGSLGWLTGIGLIASTIYAAAAARRADMWWTVIAPPLAMAAATLTAGQLTLSGSGSLLLREAFMIFGTLTATAPWTVAAVVAALVIVLVRRRR